MHRAYSICSNTTLFHVEVSFLKQFFLQNGYSKAIFERQTEIFLSKKLDPKTPILTADKKPFYYKIPFYGHKSVLLNIEISDLISEFFNHINPKGILMNNFSIGSFFKCKDVLPTSLRANVIYKYSCPQDFCESVYVGSTRRTLYTRTKEHQGRSRYTNQPLQSPGHSAVREHSERCGSDLQLQHFTILDQLPKACDVELRISESLHIFKDKPNLNETSSAFPLKIVKRG